MSESSANEKRAYPLRINADVLNAAQRWADDELRSLNAQIEYVLRDALRKAGRLPKPNDATEARNET
ncbi:MAG: Arc family DNA binding domain-containing protein [Pseudoxanthomonas sp.]